MTDQTTRVPAEPKRPGRVGPFLARHGRMVDWVIAAVYFSWAVMLLLVMLPGTATSQTSPAATPAVTPTSAPTTPATSAPTTPADSAPSAPSASSSPTDASAQQSAGPDPSAGAQPSAGPDASAGAQPSAGPEPSTGAQPSAGADPSAEAQPTDASASAESPAPSSGRWKAWVPWIILLLDAAGAVSIILWRRKHPIWFFAATQVLSALQWAVTGVPMGWSQDMSSVLAWVALYAVASRSSNRAAWICYAIWVAGVSVGASVVISQNASSWFVFTAFFAMSLGAMMIVVSLGSRQRYTQALAERALFLAAEQDQRARLAVAGERSRIAREMHDIVSHSLSVMITMSDGAAALVTKSPDRAEEAMEKVAEVGRAALGDMRRLVDVLRADDDADPGGSAALMGPQPGASDLVQLIRTFREASLPVALDLKADIPPDPALELTIYRIVQESLTNALRYATGASKVTVDIGGNAKAGFTVDVEDNGKARGPQASQGGGHGIVGMKQRAGVYSGHVEAGPRANGGWRVHAELAPGKDQA